MSERREPSSAAPRGRGSRAEGRRRGNDAGRGRGRASRDEPAGGFFDDEPAVDLGWGAPDHGRAGPPPWETPEHGGRGRGGPPSTWDAPAPRDARRGWGEPTPPPWAQGPGFGPEPPWVRAQTEEWVPVGGQRFPGDRRMMRRAPTARGRAGVPPPPQPSAQVPPARRTPLDDPVSPAARPAARTPLDQPARPAASHPWRAPDAPAAPAAARHATELPAARPAPEAPPPARRAPGAPPGRRVPEAPAARHAPEAPPARHVPEAPAAWQVPPAPPAQGRAPRPPEREAPRPRRAPDVWDGLPPAAAVPPLPPPAPPAAPRPSLGELLRGAPDLPTEDWGAAREPHEDLRPEQGPMAGWFAPAVAPADAPTAAPPPPEPLPTPVAPKRPAAGPPALDLRLDYPARPVSPAPQSAPPSEPPPAAQGEPPAEPPTEEMAEQRAEETAEHPAEAPEEPPTDAIAEPPPAEPATTADGPADAVAPAETTVDPADDDDATDAVPLEPPVAEASADTVLPVPEGTAAGAATAIRAPTALHPVVEPAESADATATEPEDPERVLATYPWRFHHETLRELVENADELRTVRDRLTEKIDKARDNAARARLLSLRAVASRILGDLGKAQADGKLALAHAEATGELRRIAIAQARLAHVLQWRGDFAEADRLFAEANSPELPDRLRATMHEHAGRSCYDQGRYMEACNHFERALDLRKVDDPELIARTEVALDAVFAKVAGNGWGPYPRERDEILRTHRAPAAAFNEAAQRWGYDGPDGETAIPPSYAEVQPFREGVAWVRRPETTTWELIDESGTMLIGTDAGYVGVASFSDGLAWVSANGRSAWVAVDRTGRVTISTGFDDVRPFRRGVAAVKRGGWGAIDKAGRTVVPTQYTAFATALTDGRYVDGFTEEGLAVVDAGGRKGVVDRTGKVILPPRFADLVIHPVAFLVGSGTGRWGALDRRGDAIIDPVHRSRADVMEQIDRLLADTKPVL